jgi:fumarate hydratase class I
MDKINKIKLEKELVAFYKKIASTLPEDVLSQYSKVQNSFKKNPSALSGFVFDSIMDNVSLAAKKAVPICQDTGIPIWYVKIKNQSMKEIISIIRSATKIATEKNYLRQNSVDPITQENPGNNLGDNFPAIYFEENDKDELQFDLLLKGAGSENVGRTYSLPDSCLNVERDIEGIKKCVIDAVLKAQGKGCPPYIISLAIGGSKDTVTFLSKKALLRKLDSQNLDPMLEKLEVEILNDINKLGIGPMGLGGNNTAIKVFITKSHRHPASFFVDICFSCWAIRRGTLVWK